MSLPEATVELCWWPGTYRESTVSNSDLRVTYPQCEAPFPAQAYAWSSAIELRNIFLKISA